MQLRRFTADTTPAALAAVRMALGDDAIILSNRKIGDQVEIIATGQMDDMSMIADSEVDELAASLSKRATEKETMQATSISESGVGLSSSNFGGGGEREDTLMLLDNDHDAITEFGDEPLPVFPALSEDHTDSPQPLRERTDTNRRSELRQGRAGNSESVTNALTMNSISAAMAKQTEVLAQHFRSLEVNLWGETAPDRSTHLQQLLSLGFGADLAIRLVESCTEDLPLDKALRQSLSTLKTSLPIANDKTFSVPGVTIMYGPPGAGKTTALIKLATEHVKRSDEQSIVIICADTRRIGAFEELQAYGKLLGVPTVHAHDAAELASLTTAFKHKELLLIDHTLPMDDRAVGLPDSLLLPQNQNEVRHLLALPATTQGATASALIKKHCSDLPMHCVLTQLDTNARLGELLNSIIRHQLPVAYWSDAASVQRPLQRADASVLIATAVAMRRRLEPSVDDQWQHQLIRPSSRLLSARVEAAADSAESPV